MRVGGHANKSGRERNGFQHDEVAHQGSQQIDERGDEIMATLYELTGIYQDIYQMDMDDETKADTLEAIDWQEDFVNKVEGYVKVVKNKEADIAARKAEIERLTKLNKSDEKTIDYLKMTVKEAMERTGNERVQTALFKVSVANTKASVIVDEEKLSSKYKIKTVTVKPDKTTLYNLLKEGKKIRGAVLQPNRSLRIS